MSEHISESEYTDAIRKLQNASKQIKPDGNPCAVCGDCGHQAWECHHSPLVQAKRRQPQWRCYHCNSVFDSHEKALEHFGEAPHVPALCEVAFDRLDPGLIAAAPALLEACEAFCDLFQASDMRPEDECYDLYQQINDAIAKAKGRDE